MQGLELKACIESVATNKDFFDGKQNAHGEQQKNCERVSVSHNSLNGTTYPIYPRVKFQQTYSVQSPVNQSENQLRFTLIPTPSTIYR